MDFLEKGLKKMQKNNSWSPSGCLILLQIKYLDHLGAPVNKEVVPRIGAWGDKEIKERMVYLKSVGGCMSPELQIDLNEPPRLDSVTAVADEVCKQILPPIEHQIAEVKDNIGEIKQQLTEVKDQIVESYRQIVDSIPRFDDLVSAVTTEVTKAVTKLFDNRPTASCSPSLGYSPDSSFSPTGSSPSSSPIHFEVPLAPHPPIPAPVVKTTALFRHPKKSQDDAQPSHSSNIADRIKRYKNRRPSSHITSPYVGGIGKKSKIGEDDLGKVLEISDDGQQAGVRDNEWVCIFSCPHPMKQIDVIQRYVQHAGADLDEQLVVARDMGFFLTRKEILEAMEDGKWITGVVISTLAALLTAETKAKVSNDVSTEPMSLYLSSFMSMDMLVGQNPPDKFMKKNSSFIYAPSRCHKIFIPMNVDNQHWYMAVVHLMAGKVEILDSLRVGKREDNQAPEQR